MNRHADIPENGAALTPEEASALFGRRGNKYGARRTWSELCQRAFDSRAEAVRGEELRVLELAGEITDLVYQPQWELSDNPRVTYRADFAYTMSDGVRVVEDVKGRDTEASRVRRAWLKQRHGIDVRIVRNA